VVATSGKINAVPLEVIIFVCLSLLGGFLFLLAAYFNWDWWFRRWDTEVALLGRGASRVFWGIAGALLVILSVALPILMIQDEANQAAEEAEMQRLLEFAIDPSQRTEESSEKE
jgi:hypothetical protein